MNDAGEDQNVETGGDSPIDPLIGVLVDHRYRITTRLARGGMATVYVAQDERLDRPVALKVMHPHLADSADFVARFRREARSAARIVHPGVVSVFDQGVVAGQGFLVMELIEGRNLRDLLKAQGAFTVARALAVTSEVLDALRAAHRMGVIHRDIKPENVLVPTDGPVRVTDFGLARAASEASMSSTGSMLGTVAYVAPEIVTHGEADARTDIYSVGVMLHEMLTGVIPWEGQTPLQIAMHHVNDDIPLPSASQPWLPSELDDLVGALAARDPDQRPADAHDALDLVSRAAASLPEDIANRRAQVQPRSAVEGNTAVLSTIKSTSPLPPAIAASAQTVVRTQAAVAPAPADPPKVRRSRIGAVLALLTLLLVVGTAGGYWWWSEYGPGAYLEMPQVQGKSGDAAQSQLEALGLGVMVQPEFSDDVQSGIVINSDPRAGESIHKDGEVRLRVSKGVDMREVPKLVGLTQIGASSALTDAGLALGEVTEEWSETVAKGLVISQGTPEGATLRHDSAVTIVVSKGREPLTVPKIVGTGADEAKAAIEALGLVAASTEEYSDTVEAGTVISQTPEAGSTLHKGDTVSYVLSKGPEMVTVPDVFGMQEAAAIAALEAQGLEVEVSRLLGGVFGTVRASDPAAGSQVRKGSTVTITVV